MANHYDINLDMEPEGYEPQPFTPANVRRLSDLHLDNVMTDEEWMDALIDTVTELYQPAETLYDQEGRLRKSKFRIDHSDDPEYKKELQTTLDELIDEYAREQVDAEAKIEERILEEVKKRYLINLDMIVSDKYVPRSVDEIEADLLEESLLQGYQPEKYDPPKNLRSIEEQREIFEEIPEGQDTPEPVDGAEWANEMLAIIKEEEMPYHLLYGQEDSFCNCHHLARCTRSTA